MKKWLLAVAIPSIVLANPYPTKESKCTSLDLRDSSIPEIRNQKGVSWCYAFSGADMLAHENQIQEPISAADVAIGYNTTGLGLFARWLDLNLLSRGDLDIPRMAHQTGFNQVSLTHALKDGWCPESVFPSEAWTKVTRTKGGWVSQDIPLDQAMFDIAALHQNRAALTADSLPYYFKFKNVDAKTFVGLLQTKNVAGFYANLRKAVCRDDRRPFDYDGSAKMVFKNPWIFSRVGEQLEAGRLVGLDYDSKILENRFNRGASLANLHTSPLVARRWNKQANSCEYLIRNSWGTDCSQRYDATYECDGGYIWLSEELIYRSMTSIVYLSPRRN